MTKKRRNLRILASIIAAGCVWATGMNSVWAADVDADKITANRITLTDGISFEEDSGNYTFDFTIGEIRALRGVYDSTGKILGDDGVVVGLQKHGAGKAIIIDEKGQIKETGSFDTTNTTLFDLMNEYGNVGAFNGFNSDGSWNITPNPEGNGNRDGVGFNQGTNGKFETIVANYVGTPNFETNNLAIENAIRLDTSNSDRFGEGAAFNETTGKTDPFKSTIFEANYDYFGVEHYTDTDAGTTSATMKIDDNGTQYTGVVKFGYDVNDNGDMSNIVINAPDRQGIISGLKAGDLTATSSDAINGAQLYEVINTGIVEQVDSHTWKVANNLNGLGNNNYVTIKDTTLVAGNDALVISDAGVLTVEVKDTDGNIVSGSADIKTWADSNYAAKTVTITDANGNDSVVNVTDQVENNYNEINNINNNNVSKVTVNGDELTFHQTIGGKDETFTYTDKHITGHSMSIDGDSITSTITTNMKDKDGNAVKYENIVRVGNATINYDGDNNQAGNTQVTNSTIEEAINNNYNKIVNVENNYVSNIVKEDEHTWKVIQGGQETITIQDTTLVAKRVMPGSVPNASPNNALSYDFDPNTGIPQVFIEFEDTSGNVVQGAIDTGALMAMTVDTTDGNIEVDFNGQGFGRSYSLSRNVDIHESVTIANVVEIDGDGIDMGDTKITNLADGRIAPDSKDAINGSQLWETNRNMDKLGGRLDKVGAGAAALAALHPLDFDPDDKLQFSAGVGNYKGETAAALGAFYRPTEKVMFSVAGTMGNGENMVNAGVTFALDRKNNVSNSRVAMAHEIKDLREQVAALTALVSQIAGKGNPLLDTVMFPDVPENHWAYDYVENLQKRGIIEGYPDGNFGGDRSMTRYEYAAMLYRALEKGFPVDGRLLKEFEAELGRIRIDRIKGADDDANKVERVRVNDYEDRDDYGSKLAQVVADAAPAIEEEPAA